MGEADTRRRSYPVSHTDEEWRALLGPERYAILRHAHTERPFSGEYALSTQDGFYHCGACGARLFDAVDKFDAGCGWPSFTREAAAGSVEFVPDASLGMVRTEVRCATCGSHLGHVFDDGPAPTGQRYCMNSRALTLVDREDSVATPPA